jgi:hypothetical protein
MLKTIKMKYRLLLLLLGAVFLNSHFANARGLVYNGKVWIEIRITHLYTYDIHDRHGGNECRIYFYKYNWKGKEYKYDEIHGTAPEDVEEWIAWTGLDRSLPYLYHSSYYDVSGKSLHDYFSDNPVNFKFHVEEHDDGDDEYEWPVEFSMLDLFKNQETPLNGSAPGWHKAQFKSKHWWVKFEYSITPPAPDLNSPKNDMVSEGSVLVLNAQDLKASNIKYEWRMNEDEQMQTIQLPGSKVDWDKYNRCVRMCRGSGEDERSDEKSSLEEEIEPPIGVGDDCELECKELARIPNTKEELVWQYPHDENSKTNKTPNSTFTYELPLTNKFHRNLTFQVHSYIDEPGHPILKSVETSGQAIVDVFPRFPKVKIKNPKKVTCFGGSDGEVTIDVDGDINKGVDQYNAELMKIVGSDTTYIKGFTGKSSSIVFSNLKEGSYVVAVSNLFTQKDTADLYENEPDTKTFLLGHDIKSFTISQNKSIFLDQGRFISKGECDKYVLDTKYTQAKGGLGEYTYSLDSISSKLIISGGELPLHEEALKYTVYIKDKKGCMGRGR